MCGLSPDMKGRLASPVPFPAGGHPDARRWDGEGEGKAAPASSRRSRLRTAAQKNSSVRGPSSLSRVRFCSDYRFSEPPPPPCLCKARRRLEAFVCVADGTEAAERGRSGHRRASGPRHASRPSSQLHRAGPPPGVFPALRPPDSKPRTPEAGGMLGVFRSCSVTRRPARKGQETEPCPGTCSP